MTTMYGFEVMTQTGWQKLGAGQQDASNLFASREDAEAERANLAISLDCDDEEVRVVEFEV